MKLRVDTLQGNPGVRQALRPVTQRCTLSPVAVKNTNIITDWAASEPLRHHLVALCLLLALSASDDVIFGLLPGLTPGQLAMLRQNRTVTSAASEYKNRFLGENAQEQFQHHMPKAFEIMTEVLNAPPGEMKLKDRFEAAKWLFEKVTGKARQELEVSGGTTILQLLQALDRRNDQEAVARRTGEAPIMASRDVTPADPLLAWVEANVTVIGSEKT